MRVNGILKGLDLEPLWQRKDSKLMASLTPPPALPVLLYLPGKSIWFQICLEAENPRKGCFLAFGNLTLRPPGESKLSSRLLKPKGGMKDPGWTINDLFISFLF